jgi:hypothetical protein
MNLLGLVSAHTGNDLYNHHMEFFDYVLSVLLVIGVVFLIGLVIRRKKKL